MKRLGISLYPDISKDLNKDKEYLKIASNYGFTRVFMCLLNIDENKDKTIQLFTKLCQYARELNYEIIFDISPNIMKKLNVDYNNLEIFTQIGATGLRLDENFDGLKEAQMTHNKENLKIEINASVNQGLLEKIMEHKPNINQLIACHNYYPLRYTGLSIQHFIETTQHLKSYKLRVAAFITSQNECAFGPWPISEGLCTLESHRDLPIDIQVKHLLHLGIDDIIIANAYASNEELQACQKAFMNPYSLHIICNDNSVLEDKIIDEHHYLRPDRSDCVTRSTLSRIKYKKYDIYPKTKTNVKKGDVIIINNLVPHYKGELQIILQNLNNDGRMNIVGRIPKEEWILLDLMNKWDELEFIRKESNA